MKVTDDTIMPFGKYQGRSLGEVPASYLLWFASQGGGGFRDIKEYIEEKRAQLEREVDEEPDY